MSVVLRPAVAATVAASLVAAFLAICGCPMMVESHDCCAAEGAVLVASATDCCQPSQLTPSTSSEMAPSSPPVSASISLAEAAIPAPGRDVCSTSGLVFSPPTVLRI